MPPTPPHPPEDPTHDRAAGALLGAAAAATLVGTPPARIRQFTTAATTPQQPGPHTPAGPAPLAHLIRTALARAATAPPAHTPTLPAPRDTAPHAWVRALSTLVRTAATPHSPELEHTTDHDPLGASWRALTHTPHPAHDPAHGTFACTHLTQALHRAHHTGGDPAAMYTGALAGARWGASALPLHTLRQLSGHTDPHTLITAALLQVRGTQPRQWPQHPIRERPEQRLPPFAVPHPQDPGVLLGNLDHLRTRPRDVDAVVSLCRTHPDDAPHLSGPDWVRVWLHDTPGKNTNLHFTLDEAATAVAALRTEGKRVLLHCWAGASRTPAVAARYATAALGAPPLPTLGTLIRTVGGHLDNPTLSQAVAELSGLDLPDPTRALFPQGLPPRRPELRSVRTTG
ncbi:dual specificity protein phosphatase family protein [Nocardiopsis terrae]